VSLVPAPWRGGTWVTERSLGDGISLLLCVLLPLVYVMQLSGPWSLSRAEVI
jgi:hypothetical protein